MAARRPSASLRLSVSTERRNTALPGLLRLPGLTPRRVHDIQAHLPWPTQGLDLKRGGCLDRGEPVTPDAGALSSVGSRLPALRPGTVCPLVLRGR